MILYIREIPNADFGAMQIFVPALQWSLVSLIGKISIFGFFFDFLSFHGRFGDQEWFGNDPEP